ncbi:hypothetical protein SAMN05661012_06061 [Chitinophaga sancti]|uniref:Uncharacterized protein n=1 Tax=Chitinophaga sancti TaxID=1004 RepID=A0A1K1ST04_9BACT|nr:hypothetical protein SAMN05661012_06061 [Chitinophaga sancti]
MAINSHNRLIFAYNGVFTSIMTKFRRFGRLFAVLDFFYYLHLRLELNPHAVGGQTIYFYSLCLTLSDPGAVKARFSGYPLLPHRR